MAEEFDLSGAADMLMSMLSDDEGKQQIQNIMSMLSGDSPDPSPPGNATGGIDPKSLEMMFKLQQVMSLMNNAENAKQTAFLQSLRALLRPERQSKVDSAVKFLSIGRAIDAFRKLEGV